MAISVAVPVGEATADRLIAALKPRIENSESRALHRQRQRFRPGGDGGGARSVFPAWSTAASRKAPNWWSMAAASRCRAMKRASIWAPCLFDRVTPQMDIYKTEIFGPVLSVVRSPDYETALGMVNDNEYGNGVAIFTRDGDAARDFANRCQIGMVGVNVPIPTPLAYYGFGGWKRSAFGDLNQHGPDSIKFWTRTKTVTARWPSGIKSGAEFSMPVFSETNPRKS